MSKPKTFSHHVFHNPDSDAFPFFCDGYALPSRKANNPCILCDEVVDRVYVDAQTIRVECPELSDSIVAFNDFRNRRVSCPTSMYRELLDSFEKYGYFYDENQYSFWRYPKCKVYPLHTEWKNAVQREMLSVNVNLYNKYDSNVDKVAGISEVYHQMKSQFHTQPKKKVEIVQPQSSPSQSDEYKNFMRTAMVQLVCYDYSVHEAQEVAEKIWSMTSKM